MSYITDPVLVIAALAILAKLAFIVTMIKGAQR